MDGVLWEQVPVLILEEGCFPIQLHCFIEKHSWSQACLPFCLYFSSQKFLPCISPSFSSVSRVLIQSTLSFLLHFAVLLVLIGVGCVRTFVSFLMLHDSGGYSSVDLARRFLPKA